MARFSRRNQKRKRQEPPGPSGFVVVDKPAGRTSHDVVDEARRWFGTRRVGHLGTLDPQATGVLPLAIRGATKLIPFMDGATKAYDGTVVLGAETDTLDREGIVTRKFSGSLPTRQIVEKALEDFRGDIQQIPPMYSAVKKDGVPLHKLARRGEEVERDPKWVTIDEIAVTRFESPELDLRVRCSSGTYVRVIAADLGRVLGCGAHLGALRRTQSGPFLIEESHPVEEFEAAVRDEKLESMMVSMADALGFPVHQIAGEQQIRLQNGGDLPSSDLPRMAPGTRISILDASGGFLAVAELRADRRLWPLRVLPKEFAG
jgi:tRNA pseudouridine55 synthase